MAELDELIIEGASCPWPRQPRINVNVKQHDGLNWHLLQARSGAEQPAMKTLERQHVESYFPQARVFRIVPQRQLSRKQRAAGATVRRPRDIAIFPGYLFVRFDVRRARLNELFDLVGVSGLVCAGDFPVVVDDAFIANVRGLEIDGAVPGSTPIAKLFEIGETVRISAGPFASFNGVVEAMPQKIAKQLLQGTLDELDELMCATIGVEIFGRISPIRIPLGHLEKI